MIYMFLSNNPSSGDINLSNLSCFFFFFSPQLILHKSNGEFQRENYPFSRFQRGSTFSRGVDLFSGGGGGGGGPIAYFL